MCVNSSTYSWFWWSDHEKNVVNIAEGYKGPWVQACEYVRDMQNSINCQVAGLNSVLRKNIPSLDLISSSTEDFTSDVRAFLQSCCSHGLDINSNQCLGLEEFQKIRNLLHDFIAKIGELDIHIISGAFICPSLLTLRPSLDFFRIWSIEPSNPFDSKTLETVVATDRGVESYIDLMNSIYVAAYYKVCWLFLFPTWMITVVCIVVAGLSTLCRRKIINGSRRRKFVSTTVPTEPAYRCV